MSSEIIAKPEPFYTIHEACELLNVPYHALLRAVRKGIVPSYTFATTRRYVLISEIVALMRSSQKGGAQ
jgi:excisionase family DNA binding protein